MKVRIDRGARTFLPLCACGWRGLPATSHAEALHEARHHERRAHPGDLNAAKMLANHNHRTNGSL